MMTKLAEIDLVLARLERLAAALQADRGGQVLRSANELRQAFSSRHAIEPAVARVLDSVRMLRTGNSGCRPEFHRPAYSVDDLELVMERELLPGLRRVGFDV